MPHDLKWVRRELRSDHALCTMYRYGAMEGVDVAELFFDRFGLPTIEEHFPEMMNRVSAGLNGRGSEVIGADDELSRDHGWGPRFCLFLNEDDLRDIGQEMQEKLNELRPSVFEGIDLLGHRTEPITVNTIDECFRDLTGAPWPPKTMREWALANENGLCYAQAGRVFYDPTGRLKERKQAFEEAYYPEPIWRWRIASKLYRLWHYGDYNTRGRLAKRNDGAATLLGQGYFVEAAMQLAFLLNRRFAPYWKWLHWGFARLPCIAGELEPLLVELESASNLAERAELIGAICDLYRRVLCHRGLFSDSNWRNFMGSFEIVDSIQDTEVKQLIDGYFSRYNHL